jgi:hypothetical protein
VLVAGTLLRFFLTSSTEHLIRPLAQQKHAVDYYLALTTGESRSWRKDSYTEFFALDPAFGTGTTIPPKEHVLEVVSRLVEAAGGRLRRLDLRAAVDLEGDAALWRAVNKSRLRRGLTLSRGDPLEHFPLLSHGSGRSAVANRNFLRVYKAIELLWDAALATESSEGWSYTHALVLRDDVNWLADMKLDRLLSAPDAAGADAHILSCDVRRPRMHPAEINDFAMLITRKHASFIGRFYSNTILVGLSGECRIAIVNGLHVPFTQAAASRLGSRISSCSSEELMRWALVRAGIRVHAAAQSLLPFQRCAHINASGTITLCMHKHCQSVQSPLPDPPGMPMCKHVSISRAAPHGQPPKRARSSGAAAGKAVGGSEQQQSAACECDSQPRRTCPATNIFRDTLGLMEADDRRRPCFYCDAGPLVLSSTGVANSAWAKHSCGFSQDSLVTAYFDKLVALLRSRFGGERCASVAFSVAFGGVYARKRLRSPFLDVNCSFVFKLKDDAYLQPGPTVLPPVNGWYPIELDPSSLPFIDSEMRRNVKTIKMFGARFFPWAKRLFWIDSKLRPAAAHGPLDFHRKFLAGRDQPCAAFIGLPAHKYAFGHNAEHLPRSSLNLRLHADEIIRSNSRRNVTSTPSTMQAQLRAYDEWAGTASRAAAAASSMTLIDSAFFAMDISTQRCADFNLALGCAWFSEMACYSDRDQVSFPMAMVRALGLSPLAMGDGMLRVPWTGPMTTYILGDQQRNPYVVIAAPTDYHHYYVCKLVQPQGRCRKQRQS